MDKRIQGLKIKYIPLCFEKKISIRKCAKKIGITPQSVCRLKNRYKVHGDACFVHGNAGRKPKNKRYDYGAIVDFYKNSWQGSPFAGYVDAIHEYKKIPVSYTTVHKVLSTAGIVSPKTRDVKKKKHLARKERPNEGDMLQMDASPYDWLFTGEKIALHGAIDDATHKITALYFCKNECALGYYEIFRRTYERFGGFPRAIYTDRASCFYTTKLSREKVTLEEQLDGMRQTQTQWQKMCANLDIDMIAALSPQAKGRIERLWQTLQGRLPYIFRFRGIKTIDEANAYLEKFIDFFNERFAVPAQKPEKHYMPYHDEDIDFLLSVKKDIRTKYDGSFLFHGHKFHLLAPFSARKKFTLCLSEKRGVHARLNGRNYPVCLDEPMGYYVGDPMPIVEKDLIHKYLEADAHSRTALIS